MGVPPEGDPHGAPPPPPATAHECKGKRKRENEPPQQHNKQPKTRFIRRRAVFGKRGTHRRVELPELAAFAAGMLELTRDTDTPEGPRSAAGSPPLVDITEAYAAFCMLLRAGEWQRVEMCRAAVHPPGQGALDLIYFLCKVRRRRGSAR